MGTTFKKAFGFIPEDKHDLSEVIPLIESFQIVLPVMKRSPSIKNEKIILKQSPEHDHRKQDTN